MSQPADYTHLEFVYTPLFESTRKGTLSDEEVHEVENILLENPEAGAVVSGTGGVRKLRAALEGRGKRGGARVVYLYVRIRQKVYFIAVFAKNVQANLTDEQKKVIRRLAEDLKKEGG